MADLIIETRVVENAPVLDLTGEVDSYNAPQLREAMVRLIEQGQPNLILNLTRVDYIDSTGLGVMVAGLKRATENGGSVQIICPNPTIYKVFQITSLNKVFVIHENEATAFPHTQ
jgi:anti-sigma B factor antagonist